MKLQLLKLCVGFSIIYVIFFTYSYLRWETLNETFILGRISNTTQLDSILLSSPLILTWTKYFGHSWIQNIKQNVDHCDYHCIITNDKEKLPEATTVLFHIRDLGRLPKFRNPKQLFLFVLQESPLYTFNYLDSVTQDYFNITMTYRRESDIYMPYGMMKKITNLTSQERIWNWNEVMKIASRKVQPVLQLVSNCHTKSKRELYVEQLRIYVNITQHGSCNNSPCDQECEIKEFAQHYFYLAFENSVCHDYITEKLFKCLARLIVPVVLKRSIYEDILPSGSFIAADDFTSPRELAEYLQYLLNNKTAYLSYLKWTIHYEKIHGMSSYCKLCKYLHKDIVRPRIIPDIRKWWFQGCIEDYAVNLLGKEKAGSSFN